MVFGGIAGAGHTATVATANICYGDWPCVVLLLLFLCVVCDRDACGIVGAISALHLDKIDAAFQRSDLVVF